MLESLALCWKVYPFILVIVFIFNNVSLKNSDYKGNIWLLQKIWETKKNIKKIKVTCNLYPQISTENLLLIIFIINFYWCHICTFLHNLLFQINELRLFCLLIQYSVAISWIIHLKSSFYHLNQKEAIL